MAIPTRLRVEHLDEAFGVTCRAPRLSWWLPAGAHTQHAYRVRTDGWDSGRIESAHNVLVPYGGPPPASRERTSWQVKVWTELGESGWSAPAEWETGLLEAADWSARWIAPVEDEVAEPGARPAHLLRRTFTLDGPVVRARAYATAHGIYELFVNGVRAGDAELAPGSTSYRANLHVQTYDVTRLLRPGVNVVGAVLSDGWYRGQNGYFRRADCFGASLALLAQVEAELGDGTRVTAATGPGWLGRPGSITAADLIEGQRSDLRAWDGQWDGPPDGWREAPVVEHDLGRLHASPAPPVRRVQELRPVSVRTLEPGRQVVDLGQNINGWVRIGGLGPRGTRLTLTHGEMLDDSGDVTLGHLRPVLFGTDIPRSAGQVDEVIAAGTPGEVFEPRHTTHGFRYVRVEGHPDGLGPDDVTGVVVHTDLRRTGWFECDDERINRLHEAAVWSFRGNACDVPTDCPQRERAGWTGDWQIFFPTAAFLYDVAGFTEKWLRDLAADQWPDGRVPNVVPALHPAAGPPEPVTDFLTGAAGWGDAAVIVPWDMWRAYGDERVLAEQYTSMTAWVDYAARRAREGRHATRVARSAEPAPHEEFLWDTGFHWGEWCEPDGPGEAIFTLELDMGDVATAYLHRSSSILAEAAALLGRDDDARRYGELARASLAAWRREFIGEDGALHPDTQANHVRALTFRLVPDELREQTADRLVELIRKAGTHLGTGFLATPYLLPVLADTGHLDVAYELLFQTSQPSWLAMTEAGATTIWESWEGAEDKPGKPYSLNHYSKGAVVSFLHRYVAGIRPDETAGAAGVAWRRFRVEPRPGGGITSASAAHDSPYGRIASCWRSADGEFTLEVTVPPGTEATVVLPDGTSAQAGPGVSVHRCPA
ncbi:family 78 glycoside hydrolase catalytic domain [Streptosporangium sp. NPDC006013]|uniref:family 78 glycoside hydrolase catalytic domain n=1 Tax=Streptosporangium sp. NPDC006013 TaxID=3155596 RepID=UPI0033A3FE77